MVKNPLSMQETWVQSWVGEGTGSPLQYSCLGNTIDIGAWQTTVHGVAKELDMNDGLNNNIGMD